MSPAPIPAKKKKDGQLTSAPKASSSSIPVKKKNDGDGSASGRRMGEPRGGGSASERRM